MMMLLSVVSFSQKMVVTKVLQAKEGERELTTIYEGAFYIEFKIHEYTAEYVEDGDTLHFVMTENIVVYEDEETGEKYTQQTFVSPKTGSKFKLNREVHNGNISFTFGSFHYLGYVE